LTRRGPTFNGSHVSQYPETFITRRCERRGSQKALLLFSNSRIRRAVPKRSLSLAENGRRSRSDTNASIRRTPEELRSPQAILLRQLPAGSLGRGSFRTAITTLRTRNNTWRASSCRLLSGTSLLSSNLNGDLGPRSYAFPNSSRVGGFQNINAASGCWWLRKSFCEPRINLTCDDRARISHIALAMPRPHFQQKLRVYHCVGRVLERCG
jgi:hypothetical protein